MLINIKYFLQRKYDVYWLGREYLLENWSRWHVLCSTKDMQQDRCKVTEGVWNGKRSKKKIFSAKKEEALFFLRIRKFAFVRKLKFGPFPRREEYREFENRRSIRRYRLGCRYQLYSSKKYQFINFLKSTF